METGIEEWSIGSEDKVPLSQGKPIEWKHRSKIPFAPYDLRVPLSQGKPIEWKRIKEQRGARESRVPLSQGKPIEWKPIKF